MAEEFSAADRLQAVRRVGTAVGAEVQWAEKPFRPTFAARTNRRSDLWSTLRRVVYPGLLIEPMTAGYLDAHFVNLL